MLFLSQAGYGLMFLLASAVSISGQRVNITSDLVDTFACPNKAVSFICCGNGAGIIVTALPILSVQFSSSNSIGDTRVFSEAVLTLISNDPWKTRLQIIKPMTLNVTCLTDVLDSGTLPLILSSSESIEPPGSPLVEGLTGNTNRRSVLIRWSPPVNPQYDIGFYRVNVLVDRIVKVSGNSTTNLIELEVLFSGGEKISAEVAVVSKCGVQSDFIPSVNSIDARYFDFYAAFAFPLAFLLLAIIIIAIIPVCSYRHQRNKVRTGE